MGYVDWQISGPKIAGCSCDYGCPCEFNGRPTRAFCEGLEAHRIDRGHFGDVSLDGLIVGAWYRWPGAVHEGGGLVQGIIDRRATPEQTDALFAILGGKEQEPNTVFNIYGSTIEKELDPIFADIEFACDMEARTARMRVGDLLSLDILPIRNPVTGLPHRARIVLPEGFEFSSAEMGSATFEVKAQGNGFAHSKAYGALFHGAYGPYGILRDAA
jgi:hypothetical protein